jgi:hypothetical protein
MSSHRTTSDYFNHRALRIRPRPPLWLARVTGYLMPNHRRTALGSPKAKTPQDALWSWLLARATARRLKSIKRLACRTTRPHSTLRGSQHFSTPRCHSRRVRLYAQSFMACQLLFFQSTTSVRVCTVPLRAFPSENPLCSPHRYVRVQLRFWRNRPIHGSASQRESNVET